MLLNRLSNKPSYPYVLGVSTEKYSNTHFWEYTLPEVRGLLIYKFNLEQCFEGVLGYGNFCLPTNHPRFLCSMLFVLGQKKGGNNQA